MAAPRRGVSSGPSIGQIKVYTRRQPGAGAAGGKAAIAFEEAHKELAAKLQQVGFLRVNNTLKKNRSKGRLPLAAKGSRDGRGLRAALRDPEFSQPTAKGWQYGFVLGNDAALARHQIKDYWRTIESGGGPVGRWFPNYVLDLGGRPVTGPGVKEAAAGRTPAAQRDRLRRNARLSGSGTAGSALERRFAAEDRPLNLAAGRAQKNWAATGAVMAEGVSGVNRRGGSARGALRGGMREGQPNAYFQVKKRIEAVGYMRLMEDKLREWVADGTIEQLYVKHLARQGVRVNFSKAGGVGKLLSVQSVANAFEGADA